MRIWSALSQTLFSGENRGTRAAAALLMALLSGLVVHAQAPPPLTRCKPANLDILVLPVANHPATGVSTMPIEFTNLSADACILPASAQLEIEPKPTGLGLFSQDYQDNSAPATIMRNRRWVLLAGETVHLLLATSSVAVDGNPCYEVDGMKLGLGAAIDENFPLTIFHVWWHACGTIYVSAYRLGAYSGDETVGSHNRYYAGLLPGDLVPPVAYDTDKSHGGKLSATFDRTLLHEYFNLYLDDVEPTRAICPFAVLRRRYDDGNTSVLLTHCDTSQLTGKPTAKPSANRPKYAIGPAALSLPPERAGIVNYDAIVETSRAGKEIYVHPIAARIEIISDEPIKLAEIDTTVPVCLAAQLQVGERIELPPVEAHTAQAFNVTNTSKYACRIGGVPKAEFFADNVQRTKQYYIFGVCPNCGDKLFVPRPAGWINLAPQTSTHLMVGELTRIREPHWACRTTVDMTVALDGKVDTLSLPLNASSCGPVDVSAWREGKYDGQPMRATAHESANVTPNPLPVDCAGKDFSQTGQPVFFPVKDGVAHGMSALHPAFTEHSESMRLAAWVDNRSDKVVTLESCGMFDDWNLALWDVYGNRLLDRGEIQRPSAGFLGNCDENVTFDVKPHSCENVGAYDLKTQYGLQPGEYRIGQKPMPSTDVNVRQSSVVPSVPSETLAIRVVP